MAKDIATDTLEQQQAEKTERAERKAEQPQPSTSETEQPYQSRHEDAEQFDDRYDTNEDTGSDSQENHNPTRDVTPTDKLRADDRDRVKESTENHPSRPSRIAEGALAATIGGVLAGHIG